MEMLDIKALSFKYPGADKMAICGLDLTVKEGEFILLCGESGSGKTTLLRLIKNEIAPHGDMSGEIKLLNFGHTIGHAIEKFSKLTISHGNAVAIGMVIATKGAFELGLS